MNVQDSSENETYGFNESLPTSDGFNDSFVTTSEPLPAEPQLAESTWAEFQISDQIWVVAGWIIIVIGSIGHALSISVLLGSKRMRLLSLTVYLVANSLAGLAALYVGLLRQVILHRSDLDVRDLTTDFGCGLHAALTYMSLQLFSWLQATIAVERTIAVLRPLRYKHWCTWRRNLLVVACVVILLGLLNAIVGSVYHKNQKGSCGEAEDQKDLFVHVWGYVDLVLFSLFPISVIVPCNVVTLSTIYQSKVESHSSSRKYIQLTAMLVAQNFVCVATTLPISILFLVPWPAETNSDAGARREVEWTVLSLLQYLGTTFGFVIYSSSARRFRRAIADLFVKGCNANLVSLSGMSSSRKQTRESKSLVRRAPQASTTTVSSPVSAVTMPLTDVQPDKVEKLC